MTGEPGRPTPEDDDVYAPKIERPTLWLGDLLAAKDAEIARLAAQAQRDAEALNEERRLRVQLSDDSQRHLDRALNAEQAARDAEALAKLRRLEWKAAHDALAAAEQRGRRLEAALTDIANIHAGCSHPAECADWDVVVIARAALAPPSGESACWWDGDPAHRCCPRHGDSIFLCPPSSLRSLSLTPFE